jgi:hypothetical protein
MYRVASSPGIPQQLCLVPLVEDDQDHGDVVAGVALPDGLVREILQHRCNCTRYRSYQGNTISRRSGLSTACNTVSQLIDRYHRTAVQQLSRSTRKQHIDINIDTGHAPGSSAGRRRASASARARRPPPPRGRTRRKARRRPAAGTGRRPRSSSPAPTAQ